MPSPYSMGVTKEADISVLYDLIFSVVYILVSFTTVMVDSFDYLEIKDVLPVFNPSGRI